MRELIIASASLDTVMAPSSTWATNSLTRFLPRSLAAGSRAMRPSSTIWASRLAARTSSAALGAAACRCWSLIGAPLVQAEFRAQLIQLARIAHGFAQEFLQLVVALQAAAQVAQALAQVQQFLQGFHLACDLVRREIVHALESQVDFQVAGVRVFAQFVFHGERKVRFHTFSID